MHDQRLPVPLAQIVSRAQRGESESLEALVARAQPIAFRQAFAVLRSRSLAEEAVQEALMHAVTSIGDLRVPEAFVVWFRRIVFHHCDRITRRASHRVVPLSNLLDPADPNPNPEELVVLSERVLAVHAAIARLPKAQRDTATAYYLEGCSQVETAEALSTSVSTINNRLNAARRSLERSLRVMQDDEVLRIVSPKIGRHSADIYDLLDTNGPAGPQWRAGRLAKSRFDWHTSRLGIENRRIHAIVGVYDLSMRVGKSVVRTAGFNLDYQSDDCSAPAMKRVTRAVVDAAREAGYGLAVSVGQSDALEAAGFVAGWPELMWFVPARAPDASLPTTLTEDFDPVYREDLEPLINAEHDRLTGTTVRPTYLSNKEPDGFSGRLWRDERGDPEGFVSYAIVESWTNRSLLGPSHRGYDRLLWHDDSAGEPETRMAILAELAAEHSCSELAFDRLHPRSRLAGFLRPFPHRIESGYRRYGLRVLSLDWALRTMVEELDRRLSTSQLGAPSLPRDLNLRLTIGDEQATIRGRAGDLSIESTTGDEPDAIDGSMALVNLLVGTAAPSVVIVDAGAVVAGDALATAEVLFRAQDPQMDNQAL